MAYSPERMDPSIARLENRFRGLRVDPPSPNNAAMDQWASPQHSDFANGLSPWNHFFANSPSPLFSNNHPANVRIRDRVSEDSPKHPRQGMRQRQQGSAAGRQSPSERHHSSVRVVRSSSSKPYDYHKDFAALAPVRAVQSAESAVPDFLPPSASPVSAEPPARFFQALQSCYPSPRCGESEMCMLHRQLAGARELKIMARDTSVCATVVNSGAADLLLSLVAGVTEARLGAIETDPVLELRLKVAKEAAAAVLKVSLDEAAKRMMRSHGVVASAVSLADLGHSQACSNGARHFDADQSRSGSGSGSGAHGSGISTSAEIMTLRELAAAIIHSLAQAEGLREDLIERGAEGPLIRLLREPSCSRDAQRDALSALFHISTCDSGRVALVEGGAVQLLLDVMLCYTQKGGHLYEDQSERFFDKAMHALANVFETEAGLNVILSSGCPAGGRLSGKEVSGLQVIFKLLATGSEMMKQHAVGTLRRVVRGIRASNAYVLDEIWLLLREEKAKPHLEALAKAGAPQAQKLLLLLFPAEMGMK